MAYRLPLYMPALETLPLLRHLAIHSCFSDSVLVLPNPTLVHMQRLASPQYSNSNDTMHHSPVTTSCRLRGAGPAPLIDDGQAARARVIGAARCCCCRVEHAVQSYRTEQNRTRTVSAAVPSPLSDRGSKHSTRTSTWARRDQQQRQHNASAAVVLARCAYVHLVLDVDVGEADVERRPQAQCQCFAALKPTPSGLRRRSWVLHSHRVPVIYVRRTRPSPAAQQLCVRFLISRLEEVLRNAGGSVGRR